MMDLTPRPYQADRDLAAVHSVLIEGRQAMARGLGSYFVHPGDVNWWLFYINQDVDPFGRLTLWEDATGVVGWSLLSPNYRAFDVFLHPRLHGTPEAERVWAWTETRLIAELSAGRLRTMWVAEDDHALIGWLERRGFSSNEKDYLWNLERSLAGDVPPPCLPPGFTVRPVAGEAEAVPRALASHAAFGSQRPVAAYVEKYRRFMQSPVYAGALDLVVVPPAADEAAPAPMAAFAIAWSDTVNGVGLFEPVGTHPRFQRRGLGKAMLLEGLHRLQAAGLRTATVCAECHNPAAMRLYESVGFEPVRKILSFERTHTKDA